MEEYVAAVLALLADELGDAVPLETVFRGESSNDVAEVRFSDGRTLMVKRARLAGAVERFETSRLASRLLRERTDVVAPRHIELPAFPGDRPGLAYWRIELPTLERLWPMVTDAAHAAALRSWGALVRRIHGVRLPGHGLLPVAASEHVELAEFLTADLEERLRPSVAGGWPAGLRSVDGLIEAVPAVAARAAGDGGRLVHNDLWYANVLCEADGDDIRCVGVLDLEDALAGPTELELAKIEVLHGPLFGAELPGRWLSRLRDGHGGAPDPLALGFFRAYHLVNMGFHAAVVGFREHADEVARTAERELDALDRPPHSPAPRRL